MWKEVSEKIPNYEGRYLTELWFRSRRWTSWMKTGGKPRVLRSGWWRWWLLWTQRHSAWWHVLLCQPHHVGPTAASNFQIIYATTISYNLFRGPRSAPRFSCYTDKDTETGGDFCCCCSLHKNLWLVREWPVLTHYPVLSLFHYQIRLMVPP